MRPARVGTLFFIVFVTLSVFERIHEPGAFALQNVITIAATGAIATAIFLLLLRWMGE